MFDDGYRIKTVLRALTVKDGEGRVLNMSNRPNAAFIFPLSGQLLISDAEGERSADPEHPIYIPMGHSYRNTCLSGAVSLLFDVRDEGAPSAVMPLPPVRADLLVEIFGTVGGALSRGGSGYMQEALSGLYRLTAILSRAETPGNRLMLSAVKYMEEHYANPELSLSEIAAAIHISIVYLNRLFRDACGIPPFRYLCGIRMRRARDLLRHAGKVSEVARAVGYSDIYQFSRAYSRFFSVPPSDEYRLPPG